jgi:hypothetical protein
MFENQGVWSDVGGRVLQIGHSTDRGGVIFMRVGRWRSGDSGWRRRKKNGEKV